MTLADFITLHTTGAINFNSQVHVLYNPIGSNQGVISAVSVTKSALSIDGDTIDTDVTNILQQVETITLSYNGVDYTLTVNSVTSYETSIPFYLFQVTSNNLIPDITGQAFTFNGNTGDNTSIFFNPTINFGIFATSDYNILLNNGNNIRKSTKIFEADREEGFAIPSNFTSILNTSASKASVQDSFYTDSGIINARYNGSKSTPSNYAGVAPSLSAREFVGDIHPLDSNVDLLCVYSREKLLEPLLHTGVNTLPGYTTSSLGISTRTGFTIGTTDTIIDYEQSSIFTRPVLDRGDIIIIEDSEEVLRVVEHNPSNTNIIVTRGEFNTTPTVHDPNKIIEKIDRTDIFKVDDFIRNLSAVNNSIIYVEESHSLIFTDDFGLLYSQSFCPPPVDGTLDNP